MRTLAFEQAGQAIRGGHQTVPRHDGRFLPRDEATLALQMLVAAWAGNHQSDVETMTNIRHPWTLSPGSRGALSQLAQG